MAGGLYDQSTGWVGVSEFGAAGGEMAVSLSKSGVILVLFFLQSIPGVYRFPKDSEETYNTIYLCE